MTGCFQSPPHRATGRKLPDYVTFRQLIHVVSVKASGFFFFCYYFSISFWLTCWAEQVSNEDVRFFFCEEKLPTWEFEYRKTVLRQQKWTIPIIIHQMLEQQQKKKKTYVNNKRKFVHKKKVTKILKVNVSVTRVYTRLLQVWVINWSLEVFYWCWWEITLHKRLAAGRRFHCTTSQGFEPADPPDGWLNLLTSKTAGPSGIPWVTQQISTLWWRVQIFVEFYFLVLTLT